MNLVAATLSLNPRLLQQQQQNEENYTMMTLDDTYMLSSIHPRVKNPLEFINLKKITTTNNLTSESEDHGSSYCGDSSMDDISPMIESFSTNFYPNEQQFIHSDNSFYYYNHHHSTHY
jgi:hypothetical protein